MAAEPAKNLNITEANGVCLPAKMPMGQATHSVGLRSGMSLIQVRRIVASLEAGHCERNIAEAERVPERIVRRIRQLELDRRSRQMSAVGLAVGGFLDTVNTLHREIDGSIFEELTEGAA